MKRIILLLSITMSTVLSAQTFKEQQLEFSRVRNAFKEKEEDLKNLVNDLNVSWNEMEVFIRALKREEILQVWIKDKNDVKFVKLKEYPFSANSGVLGPKRKQGDFQIPEGIYFIDRFNPASLFHLSLGINYPNESDRKNGKFPLGGDIFIHGDKQTIGCIPITDELIKELYVITVQARTNGQNRIPIHIFPCAIDKEGLSVLVKERQTTKVLKEFWMQLMPIFNHFEKYKTLPNVSINSNGDYVMN